MRGRSNAPDLGVLRPSDVGVTAQAAERGRALPQSRTILFNALALIDFYRRTLRHGGNGATPCGKWQQDFRDLRIAITPAPSSGGFRMTCADAWFGLSLISTFMNELDPERGPPFMGFWEYTYYVLRISVSPYHEMGQISVALLTAPDARTPASLDSADNPSANSSRVPAAGVDFAAFDNRDLSDTLFPTPSVSVPPLPNPYPVPDSDVILIFGRSMGAAPARSPMVNFFHFFLVEAYISLLEHRGDAPIGTKRIEHGTASARLIPRMRDGRPLTMGSTVADAVLGMLNYMLVQGFMATDVTIVKPDATGKRTPVGMFSIRTDAESPLGSDLATS
ncbi:MAG: hypothetical protein LQ338_007564 [Usnochroma carphineum]|nr:MAG: hypothetical protein LQ338_007564 [Usnochroma carphineum]